jgi:hypothetical protein
LGQLSGERSMGWVADYLEWVWLVLRLPGEDRFEPVAIPGDHGGVQPGLSGSVEEEVDTRL